MEAVSEDELEDLFGAEWLEWYLLTPAERWRISQRTTLADVPCPRRITRTKDTPSPFFDFADIL